jgi:hypothetical protein
MALSDLKELGLPDQLAEDVAALVRATKGHRPLAGRLARESRIFLDADLSILGASAGEYGRYAANIALEYDWFEPEAYRKGRAGVLKRFVDRKQFFTPKKRLAYWTRPHATISRESLCGCARYATPATSNLAPRQQQQQQQQQQQNPKETHHVGPQALCGRHRSLHDLH